MTNASCPALLGLWADLPAAHRQDFEEWWHRGVTAIAPHLPGESRAIQFEQVGPGTGIMLLRELDGSTDRTTASLREWLDGLVASADHRRLPGIDAALYRCRTAQAVVGSADLLDGACVLSVRLFVPDAWQAEVRDWLDHEHYQRQLAVPGARWYLGYESTAGPFHFLNLWGLDAPGVIDSAEWASARDTPWRERLLPAFAETRRATYRRIR